MDEIKRKLELIDKPGHKHEMALRDINSVTGLFLPSGPSDDPSGFGAGVFAVF